MSVRVRRPKPACASGAFSARTDLLPQAHPGIRIPAGPGGDGGGRGRGARREAPPDRGSRHGHREDAGLSGSGAAVRAARRRSPPAPKPCRSSSSSATFRFSKKYFARPLRVCYMKGRSNYACRQKIYDAENTPVLTGLEEVADFQIIQEWEKTTEIGDRAEIRTLPEDSTAWAQDRRALRTVRGREVHTVRALLHHPDAPARRRKPTSSSSTTICSSPIWRCDGKRRRASCPITTRWSSTKRTRSKTWRASISAFTVSNYRVQELRRDIAAMSRVKKFGSAELDRILMRLDEIALHFFGAAAGRATGASSFTGRDGFPRASNEEIYARPAGRVRSAREPSEADAGRAAGGHPAVPAGARNCAGRCSS